MGFVEIYDYAAGKADWFAAGLPVAGGWANEHILGDLARHDVPTCALTDTVGQVRTRAEVRGWPRCVVTGAGGVVLGEVDLGDADSLPDTSVEEAMQEGPRTFRPDFPLEQIAAWWASRPRVPSVLVTTPYGVLIGLVKKEDVVQHAPESQSSS